MFSKNKSSLDESEVNRQQKQPTPQIESQTIKQDRNEERHEANHRMSYFRSTLPNHQNARSLQQGPVSDSEVSITYRLGYKLGQ